VFPIRDINPTRIHPVVTLTIIAINVAVFFGLQQRPTPQEQTRFVYEHAVIACEVVTGHPLSLDEAQTGVCQETPGTPIFPDKNVLLAVFVSMFLHGSVLHLAGNMWFLWIFGNNVEEAYGRIGYAALYLAAGIVGTVWFILSEPGSTAPLIGASGAIAGILGAYAVLFPTNSVLTLVIIFFVPIPAIVFLVIWFLSQFGVADAGVAWQAHVGGFLFGAIITAMVRRRLLERLRRIHGQPAPSIIG